MAPSPSSKSCSRLELGLGARARGIGLGLELEQLYLDGDGRPSPGVGPGGGVREVGRHLAKGVRCGEHFNLPISRPVRGGAPRGAAIQAGGPFAAHGERAVA
eukprot:scaffold83918_cov63-Phaeocystis_antarctica.AAC.2